MAWTKEQHLAINESNKNIIVSAGAGSGKTAVLTERVLEHVKNGININEMLILTFTNAAAQEMKNRIRKKLLDNNLNEQANLVDISYITTFDAFALSILKKYSYTLNLSKNIKVIDNSIITLKKEEILNDIFEEYYDSNDLLFNKLINDFCLKDDKEIFESILSLDNSLNNLYNKEEYLNNYLNEYYNDDNISKLFDEYLDMLSSYIIKVNLQLDNISNYVENSYFEKLKESVNSLLNSKTYEEIKYNSYNVELPRLSNAQDEAKIIKGEIKSIIDDIKKFTKYSSYEEILNSIYMTKDYVGIIIKIILELNKRLYDYKKDITSFEFTDIAKMAIGIIEDNEEIRLSLKHSFKEILIDEYQDTNDLQDRFVSLIESNNQYMVGDIKQSIYRFRNANPLLFKSKYESYSKSVNDLKIDLNKNFRSRREVIDNINLIFNLIMDQKIGGANYIEEHQMIFGQEEYNKSTKENYNMEILNYELNKDDKKYSKTEIEIFTIAKDIKNKIESGFKVLDKDTFEERNIKYSDFCILMDRSKHFELYKKIFEYLNIPTSIMKDSTITDSIDIDIIKNIYNLLIYIKENKIIDKSFKYSFMSIARSFLFEISDNDILEIFTLNKYKETKIYNILNEITNDIDNKSNTQILESIIDEFEIYNNLPKIGNVKEHIITLDHLIDMANSLDDIGYTYNNFYHYLVNIVDKKLDISLSLNKDESNSVKIMTIHTSKGLEYNVVYFPSLDEKFNIRDLNEKFIFSNTYGFITPYSDNENIKNTIIKTLLRNRYLEDEISEKIRLFYVALTRAREKMIFVTSLEDNILAYKDNGIIDNNTRIKYHSFSDILNSIYRYIKKYIIKINIDDLNLTKDYNYQKDLKFELDNGSTIKVNEVAIDNSKIEKKRISKVINKVYNNNEKRNIELGLKMHYILEVTDFSNPNYDNLSEYEKELLNKFLDTKIYKNANYIYKEYEFYQEKDNIIKNGIIDLLLIFDDHNIIVDYKLDNIDDEEYKKQLNEYKKYIEELTKKKTDIYLYSIINGELKKIKG